jgi:uncharacterized membrane protein
MNSITPPQRINSIDLLRGLVIVIMALDHIRDYFHADAFLFSPVDLTQTSVPLFFTRWITHFCAPVFVFLAGSSAFLVGVRKGIKELSSFLFKRGLWLIFLELTVINFAWFFNVRFSFIALIIIWVLGIGMIVLAGLVRLSFKTILIFSVVLILGHNALDSFHVADPGWRKVAWGLLHEPSFFVTGNGRFLFIAYSMIPWIAVMSLGYCFGSLYAPNFDAGKRKKLLLRFGVISIVAFVIIRATNLYGDPNVWSMQSSAAFTVLSFLNCNKYPPSLLYLLMTLGPAMIFLSVTEHVSSGIASALTVIGRVPLFFYVIHIYVIHLIAVVAAMATGFPASAMVFNTWVTDSHALKGYGFNLGVVYLVWIAVIVGLYPLCKVFDRYKRNNRDKEWLSYC